MRVNQILPLVPMIVFLALSTSNMHGAELEDLDFGLPQRIDTDGRDSVGLKRDTQYFFAYQWVTIGILYAAPESVSGWTDEQKEGYDMSNWWDNVTHPEIDSDDFYINYVLHPYWGASYFVRAQERGYDTRASFWYSALLSTMYEFGAEALFEEPSIQDLIITPTLGSLLGQYFMRVRADIRGREQELGYRITKDKWLWVFTDPLGSLNQSVDKMFGRETRIQVRPFSYSIPRDHTMRPGPIARETEIVYGLSFQLQW